MAQIRGSPIYVVTGVALIPLSSQSEANDVIRQTKESLRRQLESGGTEADDAPASSDEEKVQSDEDLTSDEHHGASPKPPSKSRATETVVGSSIAQDVISRQGQYGRFADRWFSRKGWKTEGRRAQGMSENETKRANSQTSPAKPSNANTMSTGHAIQDDTSPVEKSESIEAPRKVLLPRQSASAEITNNLVPKLLSTTKMLLSSRSFFFSYDYDITRRVGTQESRKKGMPLHESVDPLVRLFYRWGISLSSTFTEKRA